MAFDMLTTKEAAALSNYSVECIRKWIGEGRLPATRCGTHWFISRADMETFVRPRRVATHLPPRRPRQTPGPQLVAQALLDLKGEPATPDELAVLVGRHPGNARKFLLLLEATGHAQRVEGGWVLTRAGEAVYRAEVAA